ncbi:unnamed protein product [Dibothriocephalus latus]|uniref:Uncharacterized protein n=1 Tax=Dibothriocephalus latus TaxID=60516 RepID=A0A3P7P8H6_DIBLA|nr:unnamed protein product [Dibothriocephalus latus]
MVRPDPEVTQVHAVVMVHPAPGEKLENAVQQESQERTDLRVQMDLRVRRVPPDLLDRLESAVIAVHPANPVKWGKKERRDLAVQLDLEGPEASPDPRERKVQLVRLEKRVLTAQQVP